MWIGTNWYTDSQMLWFNIWKKTHCRLWKPSLQKQDVPEYFWYEYDEEY